MRAWARTFTELLQRWEDQPPYRDQDYFDYIDGRPRTEGVAAMLQSRGLSLPWGEPEDGPEAMTVIGVGERKNAHFTAELEENGIQPYPGSLELVQQLHELRMPMAVVSSSRNAARVLQISGLDRYFPVVMDGERAAQLGLPGKPAPDTFIWAAEALNAQAGDSVVLEDAVSGVRAGAAGNFGVVIGVDRGVGVTALRDAGAHVVVTDLADLRQED